MKQILIFITTALFFVGCGGGSSSSSSGGTPPALDVDMVISEPYIVYSGDVLIKTSDPTLIEITHTDFQEESTVVLIEGSATIIRQ